MLKVFVLVTLFAATLSFTFFGQTFLQPKTEQQLIHLADYIEKGNAITPQIQGQMKNIIEQGYVFNGNNASKNTLYIQQQMNNLYPGNWVVGIYGAYGNGTDPVIGTNLGVSSYSAQGQWWIYWKGVNHYQPGQAYYLSRQQGNSSLYTCFWNTNYTYTSDVFRNVVNAAQIDYRDIQNYTAQVQNYLHGYSADIYPTVTAVNTSLSYYLCTWGNNTYNVIQQTDKLKLMIVSSPRVG